MKAKKHRDNFDYKGFGRRLRHTRIVLGLSEEEAAAAAGRTGVWPTQYCDSPGNTP